MNPETPTTTSQGTGLEQGLKQKLPDNESPYLTKKDGLKNNEDYAPKAMASRVVQKIKGHKGDKEDRVAAEE